MTPLDRRQRIKFKIEHRVSLQEIAADYIYHVDRLLDQTGEEGIKGNPPAASKLDVALRKVFLNKEYRRYLKARQLSVKDVVSWAWVLKSNTPYEAILRIFMLELQPDSRKKENPTVRIVPSFIPLLLLRQGLDTNAFRLLLIYSLHLISGQAHPNIGPSTYATKDDTVFNEIRLSANATPLVDPNTCATFVVRLLHHARQLWPQAQLPIVRTFAFYLTLLEPEGTGSMVSATPRNVQGPFTSASIQQQAQFELLKAMARNRPVLPVTRRGYQGIIAVQLAHKKTLAERQFAELKAPSWPPWKEDKLGIDSQRGIEGMNSRSMRVMSQMKEAGYAHTRWEEVSAILAGWDTDKSPTIQTRTLARQPWLLRGSVGNADHHTTWEARIRATRTVREAWACFLSYRDQGLPPRGSIYTAMAEKLIYRRNAIETNFDQTSHALPGDALETFPEPSSARDLIYVHTEPPTLDELLSQMLSEGIRPHGRFLSLLLRHASTFRSGLEYLNCSGLSNEQIKALCTICIQIDRITGWSRKMNRSIQRVLSWYEIWEMAGRMEDRDLPLGLQGFQVLCSGFSRAVDAGVKNPDAVEEGLDLIGDAVRRGHLAHIELDYPQFEDMVHSGLRVLKDQFDRLVLPDSRTPSSFGCGRLAPEDATAEQVPLPPLLHAPSPAVLHAFVRSLGLAEDYDGLLSLLRWMSQYATILKEVADEYSNGDVMLRRTMVAMRLFLEGYRERQSRDSLCWTSSAAQARGLRDSEYLGEVSPDDVENSLFSDPNLQEAYDIVTTTVRFKVARFSTKTDDAVIQTRQVPAPGSGNIRVLLLNRPKARNAISKALLDNLAKHVQSISAEGGSGPTRALIIASNADSAFCAGADLKERVNMTKEETNEFLTKLRSTFRDLAGLPVPTISAVSSTALGGGLELALCTHLRVFGSSSIVGLPETRLAIIPGAGGTYRLPGVIGVNRARDLILTGRRVSGPESYFIGLCDRLVEILPEEEQKEGVARDKVLRESIKLALDICEGGPIAIKQALQAVNGYQRGEEAENEAYAGVIETEDRYEALRAFAEKRKPAFRGR
ncbi:hypothetical protein BBP40_001754 [Aspergillus hancockii]|nr:hypothetical protein BBP40_001754 [Aspergillus hancockii]